jgi:hypothetical protein
VSDTPEQTSKKLQQKRARREADERKAAEQKRAARRRSLITMGLAVGVGILVVALIASQRGGLSGGTKKSSDIGGPESASAAGCTEDTKHEIEGHNHVATGTQVDYKTDPPTSGDHWPPGEQADPGFYSTPLDEERLVHNLEHGQIVIWYKTSASEEVKDKMEQVAGQDDVALIVVPYDFDGPGEYALTAWGYSQLCEIPSQTVIDDFRRAHQGKGPEAVTPTFTG